MTESQNPNDKSFTPDEVQKFLDAGREADFLLELKVRKLLDERNFSTSFCGRYEDPMSQKTREFDIRAEIVGRRGQMVFLSVECKNIPVNSPILVFCSKRTDDDMYLEFVEPSQKVTNSSSVRNPYLIKNVNWPPYINAPFHGRAIVQLKGENRQTSKATYGSVGNQQNGWFAKWEQAVASLSESIKAVAAGQHADWKGYYFFPFLVVPNGTLWAVEYDDNCRRNGDPKLVEFVYQHIWLSCNFPVQPSPQTFRIAKLHIATVNGLEGFLQDAIHTLDLPPKAPQQK